MPRPTTDQSDLPSAKVRPLDRIGVEGWLKFHAAYSRSFAERAVGAIAKKGDLIVDPFCGSGTTARAAGVHGCRCFTVDLNPALVALAKATIIRPSSAKIPLQRLAAPIHVRLQNGSNNGVLLDDWLHSETRMQLEFWRNELLSVDYAAGKDFARGLLVKAARDIVRPSLGSNPTWPKPPLRRRARDVHAILCETGGSMVQDLEQMYPQLKSHDLAIRMGDARKLPLEDGAADAVLTSPPYLSRIDYVRATLPELLVLGWDSDMKVRQLRTSIMGGVLTARQAEVDPDTLGPKLRGVLTSIKTHESKASESYYTILAEQYFSDLSRSLAEMKRVLKPGGRGLVVVQSSFYKDVAIPLPSLVLEMLEGIGCPGKVLQEEAVSQHFGHLSPHQRKYVCHKVLQESVVLFQK